MQIGTFNGVQVLAFPSVPGIRQMSLKTNDTNAVQRSPYTQSTQVQAWSGADWWTADLTLPQMTIANAAVWSAFLAECRGMLNVFLLGHPLFTKPQAGAVANSRDKPVSNGVNFAMATTLSTRGWRPNEFRLLLPGDMIQIGETPATQAAGTTSTTPVLCRYHRVLEQVNSDASGDATFAIWPSIRESTTDGEAVNISKAQGLWRLATNDSEILTSETRLSAFSLKIMEAR